MSELNLSKLKSEFNEQQVLYFLEDSSRYIPLHDYLGKPVKISFLGDINCVHCSRKTNKSFAQGHCYPCFKGLASCDMCLMKPETCHYAQGTCREPQWGEEHCFQTHTVYLANSSGLKVGITRGENPITRWIDQGAIAGIPLAYVDQRIDAGRVEVALKDHIADKTNWRKMLKGDVSPIDLVSARNQFQKLIPTNIPHRLSDAPTVNIHYPVIRYPEKIKSLNLDKEPVIDSVLQGIKGQYLIFESGVINIRKYSGYRVKIEVH